MSRWILLIGAAIAGGIIALVVVVNNSHSTKTVTTTVVQQSSGTAEPTSFAGSGSTGKSINQIYREDSSGVVDIKVESKTSSSSGGGLFGNSGGSQTEEGEGAGVVYNDKGYIITDEHVITGAFKVQVTFADGRVVPAKVIGSDAGSDVGVIKVSVPTSELHPIAFANSDSAQVGDPVVAIGSPFSLPETVTAGIVSQTGRPIQAPNGFTIPAAIQTDAAINPGNSGGPLLNTEGQVLGLNDQIETDNTNSQTGEGSNSGIGFATPGNEDVKVANLLIGGKTVHHPYLGVGLGPVENGAEIQSVQAGGPAARAGLEVNDVVTAVDGKTVTSEDALIALLNNYSSGQKVTLTIKRSGQTKTLSLTLGARPKTAPTSG